jgi:cobalamin biosynthesis Mg chelatase CobN
MPLARLPRARSSVRPGFSLLSVLAVLAIACFPGLAQAEESSGIQYETDVPTVPSQEGSNIPSTNGSGGSDAPGGPGAQASGSGAPGDAGSGGSGGSNGGSGADKGQPNQGSGAGGGQGSGGVEPANGELKDAEPITSLSGTSVSSTDDGSSPLIPILIAAAVLAAISIGGFYYRQRRQGAGSPISPKAS